MFHDLRRSAKTNMVKAGVNKVYRDLILGPQPARHGRQLYCREQAWRTNCGRRWTSMRHGWRPSSKMDLVSKMVSKLLKMTADFP